MTSELAARAPQPIADAISATLPTMTLVVKLGSSIVAADDGELRADVLDSVCAQVSALERGGRAGGDGHLRGDRARYAAAGAAACARGRWTSCRPPPRSARATSSAPTRAASRHGGTRAAQVLLTARRRRRPHQLPERPPDAAAPARLGRGAGDQRERHHRHRRDHLRRQRLPRRPGGAAAGRPPAGPADQHRRRASPPIPRLDAGRRADRRGRRLRGAGRRSRSATAPRPSARGGMRSKVAAARDGQRVRHPGGDLQRHRAGHARRGGRRRAGRHPLRARSRPAPPASSSGSSTRSRPPGRLVVDAGAARGPARERLQPAAGRHRRGRGRASTPATRSTCAPRRRG